MTHTQRKEVAIRKMVLSENFKVRRRVIEKMLEEWDEGGSGSFARYIKEEFPIFWIEEVACN